ncbi:MAG: helix-turn-helix transcriptional regulator [Synergistaceae bacterium]|nr:helix-turn-helix transcriptional regulator [Candidatus Equadaptatus faecalis]
MLSDRIRHYRKAKKLTQSELSELLFVSPGYITEIEAGRRTPSLSLLVKLFDLLDCSPNDLFEYDGNKNRRSETDDGVFRISDKTIASTMDLMRSLSAEDNYKLYTYATILEQLSKSRSDK